MPEIIEITDLSSPELTVYTRLTEAQLRSREGIFIAEGVKVAEYALKAGCRPVSLLMERKHVTGKAKELIAACGNAPVYTAESDVLARLTGYPLTRGVLCAMTRPPVRMVAEVCAKAKRLAVLEGIVDPTNVGAVFRSAAALGVDGILLTPTCCDPLSRRGIRVSMGTVFQVPWARLAAWPEDAALLQQQGFRLAALALDERAVSIDDPRLKAEKKLAVVLGAEGDGLASSTVARCDYTVKIPMANGVDSLNVAAAGAVAFWELRVQ